MKLGTLALGPFLGSEQGVQGTQLPSVSISHPLKRGPLGVNAKDPGLLPREDLGPLRSHFRSTAWQPTPLRATGPRELAGGAEPSGRGHSPRLPLTSQITPAFSAIAGRANLPKIGNRGCCCGSGRTPLRRPQWCPCAGGGGGGPTTAFPESVSKPFFLRRRATVFTYILKTIWDTHAKRDLESLFCCPWARAWARRVPLLKPAVPCRRPSGFAAPQPLGALRPRARWVG